MKGIEGYTLGLFIRNHLLQNRESYAAEIHRAYKDVYRGQKTTKERTYRLSTYHSFLVYVRGLIRCGLVERSGRAEPAELEPSINLEGISDRVYVKLTPKGERAPQFVWMHPLRLFYHPQDWELEAYRDYTRVGG